ncbi:TPA: DUF2693 domain-containing protein [Salmonella enterica]|nr:DUF2693 domain-containing protein [Salmonella enterica]HCH9607945.1 DUF2693 domain-containing protein [Salmonella enterica]HDI5000239.1 DUF2693 domain-containing protein [Salmonella enterica]HDI5005060.1 DUF2693 domain-containing protein [Salmonella enterica]
MNTNELKSTILATHARLFKVVFKKSDGTVRTMYAKTDIKRFKSKKPNKRKAGEYSDNLIRVFDMELKQYRSFNLSSVIEFSCNNKHFKLEGVK